jgi:hypothetical protein
MTSGAGCPKIGRAVFFEQQLLFFSFSGLSAATEVVMFTNRSNYQSDCRQRQRLIEGHRNKAPIWPTGT